MGYLAHPVDFRLPAPRARGVGVGDPSQASGCPTDLNRDGERKEPDGRLNASD